MVVLVLLFYGYLRPITSSSAGVVLSLGMNVAAGSGEHDLPAALCMRPQPASAAARDNCNLTVKAKRRRVLCWLLPLSCSSLKAPHLHPLSTSTLVPPGISAYTHTHTHMHLCLHTRTTHPHTHARTCAQVRGFVVEVLSAAPSALKGAADLVGYMVAVMQRADIPHNVLIADSGMRIFVWPQVRVICASFRPCLPRLGPLSGC